MALLNWRHAVASDKAALQAFECTTPAPRLPGHAWKRGAHPRPWELAVQKGIHKLRLPCGPGEVVLVGEDEDGIAAVAIVVTQEEPGFMMIEGVGVALRMRGCGGVCADEAVSEAIAWAQLQGDSAGLLKVTISGMSHRRNSAGERLMARNGFERFQRTTGATTWIQEVPVPDQ